MLLLGFLATLVFALAWALFIYLVITDPPELEQPDLIILYLLLASGVLVIARSLALGF